MGFVFWGAFLQHIQVHKMGSNQDSFKMCERSSSISLGCAIRKCRQCCMGMLKVKLGQRQITQGKVSHPSRKSELKLCLVPKYLAEIGGCIQSLFSIMPTNMQEQVSQCQCRQEESTQIVLCQKKIEIGVTPSQTLGNLLTTPPPFPKDPITCKGDC